MSGRELPPGWESVPLSAICNKVTDGTHQSPKYEADGIPFLVIGNVISGEIDWKSVKKWISHDTYASLTARVRPERGDVLYTAVGSYGTAVAVHDDRPFAFQRHIAHIKPNPSIVDADFLARWLNCPEARRKADAVARGVAQKTVTLGELAEFEVPLAPLPEQRRIVEKIEALTARSRRAREALDSLLALIDRYRQSILAAAFRGDLTSDGDSGRRSMPVGELVAEPTCNGISIRGTDTPPGIPALKLNALTDQGINFDARRYIPLEESRARRIYIRKNDFFVSRGNGSLELVGRGALASTPPEEIVFPDTMIRIRLDQNTILPEWFALIWGAPQVREQIRSRVKTTAGIWKISQHDLSSITVDVPNIDVQAKEIRQIRLGLGAIEKCRVQLDTATDRLATLDQSILAKAFRGELVRQDPNDEPASVLLERIRAERAAAGAAPRRGRRGKGA